MPLAVQLRMADREGGWGNGVEPFAGFGPYWQLGTPWGTPDLGTGFGPFAGGSEQQHPPARSDADLARLIMRAIERNPAIHSNAGITVTVTNGTATITGRVRNRAAKQEAGDAAWFAPGIRDVQNNIQISGSRGRP
ncbi:MAG: BON domain-containing protein [Chloroflexota bacterium]